MAEQPKQNPHQFHRRRMKQQFIRGGIDQFEPHQVLELLLFYGIPQKDTNPLAHRLLDRFGDLPSVLDADYEELCRVDGISEHSATLLVLCGQLLSRYYKEKTERRVFSRDEEFLEFFRMKLLNEKQEKVLLLSLNNRGQMLNCSVVHTGTMTSVDAGVRELVEAALRDRATTVVMAHNHPVGRSLPSGEDVTATKEIAAAFRLLGIDMRDHIVVAQDETFSMRNHPYYAPMFSEAVLRMDKRGK